MAVESIIHRQISGEYPDPDALFFAAQSHNGYDFFSPLKRLDSEPRREVLKKVFSNREQYEPNGEPFAVEVSRLMDIDSQVRFELSEDGIEKKVTELRERLGISKHGDVVLVSGSVKNALKHFEKAEKSDEWREAWCAQRDLARDALTKSERYVPWGVARTIGEAVVTPGQYPIQPQSVGRRFGSHLQWVTVQDKLSQKSPFNPLIDLYEAGLQPLGETNKGFILYVPE